MRVPMNDMLDQSVNVPLKRQASIRESWSRRLLFKSFEGLREGELILREGTQELRFGTPSPDVACAIIVVRDPALYPAAVLGGSVGAGRAYMNGWWDSPDLTAVVRLLVRNTEFLERWRGGATRFLAPVQAIKRFWNRNTLSGSRRNISAHYDLSNEFFELFLDDQMMYSSALFSSPSETLEQASKAKLDRICRELKLGPDDHVVEIGTGWGGFAVHAAREYGCRVTTTTISAEQFAYARKRVAEAGLADRITVLDHDYRELRGQFDALVSIEMIEAVGADFLDGFFQQCDALLKPSGRMLLQAITIGDDEFERAARSTDFIQEYIFPGSCLPSVQRVSDAVGQRTNLALSEVFDMTSSYAETLRQWQDRFLARLPRMAHLGFDERFLRMWNFYLCYCEGGFRESRIGCAQLRFTKLPYLSNPS